jgi:hypothetical protein
VLLQHSLKNGRFPALCQRANNMAFMFPLMPLALLLLCDLSAGLAAQRAVSHANALPSNSLLPLPPKSCQTDDPLAGLEQLAGPDVQGNYSVWEEWLQELKIWRTQVRESMSYSDERYALHPWTQRNFVSPQMHPFDAAFYTQGAGYTPEAWLHGLLQRYGGVDSVLLWVT